MDWRSAALRLRPGQVLATSDGGRAGAGGHHDLGSISALSYDGAVAVGVTRVLSELRHYLGQFGRTWSEVANSAACGQVSAYGQTCHGLFQLARIWEYVRSVTTGPHWQRAGHSPPGAPSSRSQLPFHNMACGSPGRCGNLRQRSTLAGRPAEAALCPDSQSTLLNTERGSAIMEVAPKSDRVTFSGSDCLTASRYMGAGSATPCTRIPELGNAKSVAMARSQPWSTKRCPRHNGYRSSARGPGTGMT